MARRINGAIEAVRRFIVLTGVLAAFPFLPLSVGYAADLTSTSFIARAGHVSASASSVMTAQSGLVSSSGSAGQAEPVGLGGTPANLLTAAPGFWPIVVGDLATIDADADGVQILFDNCSMVANADQLDFDGDLLGDACDDDDDGDGLDDLVETNTGTFASPTDTGSNPLDADSDDDGFDDGEEVLAGSNPNDPSSTPLNLQPVPTLSEGARWIALPLLLLVASMATLVRRRTKEMPR